MKRVQKKIKIKKLFISQKKWQITFNANLVQSKPAKIPQIPLPFNSQSSVSKIQAFFVKMKQQNHASSRNLSSHCDRSLSVHVKAKAL
ncbi:hypothetical protein KFK09_007981 [Dendrobium nobile]|uniref:Uncharacterized protein n=1 Tax=Dendrobium nobile TaxID=94219 RepID=A0A8T3BTB8_DENNO|nr:hypothetical protein KFK09_007981 [Dendrobium nobile]